MSRGRVSASSPDAENDVVVSVDIGIQNGDDAGKGWQKFGQVDDKLRLVLKNERTKPGKLRADESQHSNPPKSNPNQSQIPPLLDGDLSSLWAASPT